MIYIASSLSKVKRNLDLINYLEYKSFDYKIVKLNRQNPIAFVSFKEIFDIKFFYRFMLYLGLYFVYFPLRLYWIIKSDYIYINSMGYYFRADFVLYKIFKKKVITDFYSLFYVSEILDEELPPKKGKFYFMLEKKLLDISFYRIFMSKCESQEYRKIYEIKNGDNNVILPFVAKTNAVAALNYFRKNSPYLNIFWVGNVKPHHGLIKILCALEKMIDSGYNIKLYVFAGYEYNYEEFKKVISELSLDNYIFTKYNFEYTYSNNLLTKMVNNKCDLMLGAFGNDSPRNRSDFASIIKLYDSVVSYCPVLTKENCASRELLGDNIFYCDGSVESISAALIKIYNMKLSDINAMVENAYNSYTKKASFKNYMNIMDSLFTS